MTVEKNQDMIEALLKNISLRAHRYFPDLSSEITVEILDQDKRLVRKNSTLFEISVFDHSRQTTRGIFVKIPKVASKGAVKSLYQHLVRVYEFSTRLPEELNVVRPLDCLPEFGAIVTERVDGEALKNVLRSGQRSGDHRDILRNCGRFFRAYHEELGHLTWQTDFREKYLQEFRESMGLLKANGVRRGEAQEILAEVEKGVGRLKDGVPICSTEKDYRPGNIIIQRTRIFLIDVDPPISRPVYEDHAKFLNDLTTLFLGTPWFLFGHQAPLALRREFLAGYFGESIPIDLVSLFCAKNLCYRWHRALKSLLAGRYQRNRFLMPQALYRRQIDRFFYTEIMAQLQIVVKCPEKPIQCDFFEQFRALA